MTTIENTELSYEEYEAVGLDRFLCTATETKEAWAQRVWHFCRRQSEGEDLSRVYKTKRDQTWQERAEELWEEKKMRRCQACAFEFGETDYSEQTLLRIKDDPKYQTAEEMYLEEQGI